jgi:hypothetical protein
MSKNIVKRLNVTVDGVWIGDQIYWTLTLVTANNYDSLTELHTPRINVTTEHKVFSGFTSCCFEAVSNGGHSPSSGFQCPRSQLSASHNFNSQLTQHSLYTPSTDLTENVSGIVACSLFAGETTCPESHSITVTVVLSPVYTAVTWQWVCMS